MSENAPWTDCTRLHRRKRKRLPIQLRKQVITICPRVHVVRARIAHQTIRPAVHNKFKIEFINN